MAKAYRVLGNTGLDALIAVHDVTPFDRLTPSVRFCCNGDPHCVVGEQTGSIVIDCGLGK